MVRKTSPSPPLALRLRFKQALVLAVCVAWAADACGTRQPGPATEPAEAPLGAAVPPPAPNKPFWDDCARLFPYDLYAVDLLQVDARNPSRLLLAHKTRGIYASNDAGSTWSLLTPPGTCNQPLDTFAAGTALPDTLCVQVHNETSPYYLQIYCSESQGQAFRRLSVPPRYEDFVDTPLCDTVQPQRMVATLWSFGCPPAAQQTTTLPPCETLAWSADAGRSWQIVDTQRAGHLQVALSRDAEPLLYVVHSERGPRFTALHRCTMDMRCEPFLKVGDRCAFANLLRLQINPTNGAQMLFDWGDDGTWVSSDGGATCQPVVETDDFLDPPMFIAGDGPWGTLARLGWGAEGRFLLLSRDGGRHWQTVPRPLPDDAGELVPNGSGQLFYAGFGTLYRSDDLGNSWLSLPFPGQ